MAVRKNIPRDLTSEEELNIIIGHAENEDKYKRICSNVKEAIEQFLKECKISYLAVDYRVKDLSSLISKIKSKGYQDVFEECEDICGVRIICYFQDDIEKINSIIKKEFEIINAPKASRTKKESFGYRSDHFVVKLKKGWIEAPTYRGLENIKIEIQVRTILMHAWAEIEHKLAYKKKEHIPPQFRRDFAMISAQLEGADKQFERIREGINLYKKDAQKSILKKDFKIDLNLDNLQVLFGSFFPNRKKCVEDARVLLDDALKYDFTINNLAEWFAKNSKYMSSLEKEVFGCAKGFFTQTGAARMSIILGNEEYMRKKIPPDITKEIEAFKTKHGV